MNDIDILEEFINYYNTDEDLFCFVDYNTIQAISNLISENKELKEENKHLIEINNKYNDMKYISRIAMLYISKDKIRELLKEITDDHNRMQEGKEKMLIPKEIEIYQYEAMKSVLEELVED